MISFVLFIEQTNKTCYKRIKLQVQESSRPDGRASRGKLGSDSQTVIKGSGGKLAVHNSACPVKFDKWVRPANSVVVTEEWAMGIRRDKTIVDRYGPSKKTNHLAHLFRVR